MPRPPDPDLVDAPPLDPSRLVDPSPVRDPSSPPPLPPPPERRLPPWVDAARRRIGLDGRAWAWIGAAVVAVLVGLWLLRPAPAPVEETLPMASTSSSPGPAGAGPAAPADGASSTVPGGPTSSLPTEVVVHAAGAVARPGVYTLDPTARVDDLVHAAGGLAPDADEGRINLASPLADGARIYVPRIGEADAPTVVDAQPPAPDPSSPTPDGASGGSGRSGDAPSAPIDLNTATEAELDELPGVGPAIAAAIVAFRTENGGFATVEDLLDVRGIGEAKLAEIQPLVTV